MRGVGEAVDARRDEARERSRPEQVLVRFVRGLEREQDAGEIAFRSRQEEVPARLRLEAGGVREGARARIEAVAKLAPCCRVHKSYRNRRGGVAAREKDRMHRRIVPECALL